MVAERVDSGIDLLTCDSSERSFWHRVTKKAQPPTPPPSPDLILIPNPKKTNGQVNKKQSCSSISSLIRLGLTVMDVFDLVVPIASLGSIILCFVGPLLAPKIYLIFLFVYFAGLFVVEVSHFVKFRATAAKITENVSGANLNSVHCTHTHVFIIPNYNEPLQLLRNTISRLSMHSWAKSNYIIVLAMEETEEKCKSKADLLVNEFGACFKDFLITIHPAGLPGEARGKGSNVNFAARQACSLLTSGGLSMKQMIVTVSDSDAAIPELYIKNVEKAILETNDPYSAVYCPPIFFSRNANQVPAAVRITDVMWSIMVMQNLSNSRGLMFPCSSYSLSMSLADKINYWDTDFAAIGEDMHMMLKCFFKTGGKARAVPIYTPLNFTNVQGSGGYLSNVYARYVQAKRHYYGAADVGYTLRHTANTSQHARLSHIIDRVMMCLRVLEAHLIPSTSGWFVALACYLFQYLQPGIFDNEPYFAMLFSVVKVLGAAGGIPLFMCLFYYEFLHRTLDQTLFRKTAAPHSPNLDKSTHGTNHVETTSTRTRNWMHLLDYCWLPVSAFFFMTIPSTEASLKRLMPNNDHQYVTSEKLGDLDD